MLFKIFIILVILLSYEGRGGVSSSGSVPILDGVVGWFPRNIPHRNYRAALIALSWPKEEIEKVLSKGIPAPCQKNSAAARRIQKIISSLLQTSSLKTVLTKSEWNDLNGRVGIWNHALKSGQKPETMTSEEWAEISILYKAPVEKLERMNSKGMKFEALILEESKCNSPIYLWNYMLLKKVYFKNWLWPDLGVEDWEDSIDMLLEDLGASPEKVKTIQNDRNNQPWFFQGEKWFQDNNLSSTLIMNSTEVETLKWFEGLRQKLLEIMKPIDGSFLTQKLESGEVLHLGLHTFNLQHAVHGLDFNYHTDNPYAIENVIFKLQILKTEVEAIKNPKKNWMRLKIETALDTISHLIKDNQVKIEKIKVVSSRKERRRALINQLEEARGPQAQAPAVDPPIQLGANL